MVAVVLPSLPALAAVVGDVRGDIGQHPPGQGCAGCSKGGPCFLAGGLCFLSHGPVAHRGFSPCRLRPALPSSAMHLERCLVSHSALWSVLSRTLLGVPSHSNTRDHRTSVCHAGWPARGWGRTGDTGTPLLGGGAPFPNSRSLASFRLCFQAPSWLCQVRSLGALSVRLQNHEGLS